jgi:hypothetical protein
MDLCTNLVRFQNPASQSCAERGNPGIAFKPVPSRALRRCSHRIRAWLEPLKRCKWFRLRSLNIPVSMTKDFWLTPRARLHASPALNSSQNMAHGDIASMKENVLIRSISCYYCRKCHRFVVRDVHDLWLWSPMTSAPHSVLVFVLGKNCAVPTRLLFPLEVRLVSGRHQS